MLLLACLPVNVNTLRLTDHTDEEYAALTPLCHTHTPKKREQNIGAKYLPTWQKAAFSAWQLLWYSCLWNDAVCHMGRFSFVSGEKKIFLKVWIWMETERVFRILRCRVLVQNLFAKKPQPGLWGLSEVAAPLPCCSPWSYACCFEAEDAWSDLLARPCWLPP